MVPIAWALLLLAPLRATASVEPPPPPSGYEVVTTGSFVFQLPETRGSAIDDLVTQADEDLAKVCEAFPWCIDEPITVRVATSMDDYTEALGASSIVDWAVGVAMIDAHYVVIRADEKAFFTFRETFVHELSHMVLNMGLGGRRVPRWFDEGVAIHVAGQDLVHRLETANAAILTDNFLSLDDLTMSFPTMRPLVNVAYAVSALFVHHMYSLEGEEGMTELFELLRDGWDFKPAFKKIYEADLDEVEADWNASMQQSASIWPILTTGTTIWFVMTGVFLLAYLRQRRRSRARMELMEAQERTRGPRDDADLR